jgi:hypothetical protein
MCIYFGGIGTAIGDSNSFFKKGNSVILNLVAIVLSIKDYCDSYSHLEQIILFKFRKSYINNASHGYLKISMLLIPQTNFH